MRHAGGVPTQRGPATNRALVNQQDRLAAVHASQRDADLQAVLLTPAGRRLLWGLIAETCGTFKQSYTGNSDTFHREGARSVGVHLVSEAQRVAPELYLSMQKEALEALRDNEIRSKAIPTDEALNG